MTRLMIHVEGPTEEIFVNRVLAQHLYGVGYTQVSARMMGKQQERNRRGGVRPWLEERTSIVNHLKEDSGIIVTTMVDYYGMPQDDQRAWPGRAGATAQLTFPNSLENSLLADVSSHMGGDTSRFIPFVVMHEFEALLFSDCNSFAHGIGQPHLASEFQAIRSIFASPEDINDSSATAPSKRIESLVSGYQKPNQGLLAATAIGLPAIRAECGHFRGWLEHLEGLANRRSV